MWVRANMLSKSIVLSALHRRASFSMGLARGVLVVAVGFFGWLCPRAALAHTPGISTADIDVKADDHVEARLTFASAELLSSVALDRDRDGIISAEDVLAARDDLRAFVVEGTEVDADGAPCPATFLDASLTEVDGLVLEADYACPSDAATIEATLYYLSAPPGGDARLHGSKAPSSPSPRSSRSRPMAVARIAFGSATTEGVLTGEHRAMALRIPGRPDAAARKSSRWSQAWGRWRWSRLLALAAAAVVVALLAYGSQRWRAARTAWQNRTP